MRRLGGGLRKFQKQILNFARVQFARIKGLSSGISQGIKHPEQSTSLPFLKYRPSQKERTLCGSRES